MTKLFIIVVAATVFNGSLLSEVKPVIHLNKLLSISQSEGLWPYGVASSNLIEKGIGTISVRQKIIYYDIESGEIIQTMKLDQRKRYSMDPISFGFIKGNIASVYFNPSIGIFKFGIFDLLSGKVMRSVDHHMSGDRKKLVYLKEEDSFVVGGLFMTGYKKILDLYDEDSFNPSQYSLSKFREFFEKNRAYSLCKYDQQLNIIDSADFVSHTGENLEVYIRLKQFQAMDIDDHSNIYLVNPENGFNIKVYSGDFNLKMEFKGNNSHYQSIPKHIKKTDIDEYQNIGNTYSVVYALFLINDNVITSFYKNVPIMEKPKAPYYFDVFSKDGEKRSSGSLPFPLFGRDDSNNLFLYVKVESNSFFGDDDYYLVAISVAELSRGVVDREYVLHRINASKKD